MQKKLLKNTKKVLQLMIHLLIIGSSPNKLSHEKTGQLDCELTYKELSEALKCTKNSKSPGNDAFSVDFFV